METDVLVVAAHLPELAAFRALLGDGLSADLGGIGVVAKPVGIGLSAAAAGTAFRVGHFHPRAVVLVGTCGVYPSAGPGIGDVVAARKIHLVSIAVAEGRGILPAPMTTLLEAHAGLSAAVAGAYVRGADVATTLAVTSDDALARQIAGAAQCHVEHLEAFSVAEACALRGVPFAAFLGVSNVVGAAAHEQWVVHHRPAGVAAAGPVIAWLQAGAPGLPARPEELV
jgi:nucleoside phosphorylase